MILNKHNLIAVLFLTPAFLFGKKKLVTNRFKIDEELQVLKTVNQLRSGYNKNTAVEIEGYYNAGDGGGGIYAYDCNDTTSADNGGSILVTSGGKRFKLKNWDGDIRKFGAHVDGINDDSKAVENAINAEGWAVIPKVGYNKTLLVATIKINKQAKISGDGTVTTKPGKQNIFQVSSAAPFEVDDINIDLPAGFDGDVIRTESSPTYANAPVSIKNIKGITQGGGRLVTIMERRTNVTIVGCYWQGGVSMCLLRASRNANITNNTVIGASRGIVFFGGSFNTITGNTIKGENTGKTGINFFSNRSAAGSDNLEKGNLINQNNIHDVTEEGISFDCIGNDISRSPENPVAPVVTVDKLLSSTKSQLNIAIANIISADQNWANNYYAVVLTGNNAGLMFAINKSTPLAISLSKPDNNESYDIQTGDKILITAGAIQNKIIGNIVDNAGTHAIALYGSCWGNQIKQNTITNAKWRGITVASVLGGPGNEHAYSGMNIIENNIISMNYDPNNKKTPKLPGASVGIESREYSKDIDYIKPRTFGNLVLNNKLSNMPVRIIKSYNNNIISNQIINSNSGIELINAFNTTNFENKTATGSVVHPLISDDNTTGTSQTVSANSNKNFSADNVYKKFTITFSDIAPSSSETQYLSIENLSISTDNISVAPVTALPEDCIYSYFTTSQNKIAIRIFNLSLTNVVSPASLIFAIK